MEYATANDRLRAVIEVCARHLEVSTDLSAGQLRSRHGAELMAYCLQDYYENVEAEKAAKKV